MNGIDISIDQGAVDWNTVKGGGSVQFVYAKATEGATYRDTMFRTNHDGCKSVGIPFGAYHFFRFGVDAESQADHFLSVIDGYRGQLIPMVDVEADGQDGVTYLGALVSALSVFTRKVENVIGKRMVIYSDYGDWNGFMQGTDAFSGHPFWVAEYNHDATPTLPAGFSDYVLWQYTSGGVIPGINGFVDLDRTKAQDLGGILL